MKAAVDQKAVELIERAWDAGYTGQLGPRPADYHLHVDGNTVVFSNLKEDDEELIHICLNCLLLDRNFVDFLVGENPDPHLRELVCLTTEQKVKYLLDRISAARSVVYSA